MNLTDKLPHKAPFKFADKVLEFQSGERIKGVKYISHNEPGLQGHFPDEPIFPGVLIIETMTQFSGLCIEGQDRGVLSSVDGAKFLKPVVPGDMLIVESTVTTQFGTLALFEAKAFVDNELVAKAKVAISFLAKAEVRNV